MRCPVGLLCMPVPSPLHFHQPEAGCEVSVLVPLCLPVVVPMEKMSAGKYLILQTPTNSPHLQSGHQCWLRFPPIAENYHFAEGSFLVAEYSPAVQSGWFASSLAS